ncbi:serine protease inhibitor [Streptomyces sp. NPDC091272]|uniref:serine protease inhibitor n=1 Tax=Streptomyces sp. NPDC091272 TaxID=3365981 RepID=UPI0037F44D40
MKKLKLVLGPVLASGFAAAAFTAPPAAAQAPLPPVPPVQADEVPSAPDLLAEPKCSWPELRGSALGAAERAIGHDRPDVTVVPVPEGSAVTMELREDRVRVVHDAAGRVVGSPRCG